MSAGAADSACCSQAHGRLVAPSSRHPQGVGAGVGGAVAAAAALREDGGQERCHGNGLTAVTGSDWRVRGRRWQREHGGAGGPGDAGRWRRRGRAPRGSGSLRGTGNLLPPRRCPVSGEGEHHGCFGGGTGRGAGRGLCPAARCGCPAFSPGLAGFCWLRCGLPDSDLPPVSPQAWSPRCRRAGSRGNARRGTAGEGRLSLSGDTFGVCETCTLLETLVSVLLFLLHPEEQTEACCYNLVLIIFPFGESGVSC